MDEVEQMLKATFLEEAADLLANTEQSFLELERSSSDPELIEGIFRLAHSLKGSAGACGFEQIASFTHDLESVLLKIKQGSLLVSSKVAGLLLKSNDHLNTMIDALKENPDANFDQKGLLDELRALSDDGDIDLPSKAAPPIETTREIDGFEIWGANQEGSECPLVSAVAPKVKSKEKDEQIRIRLSRLDSLMNDVGELVILQTVLGQNRHLIPSQFLQQTISQLTKICRSIQDTAMGLRMVPVRSVMQKMQRVVRDTSMTLGKNVDVVLRGEETELDRTVLDLIGDPLVHLVRNAVDHGVEMPEDREQAGKSRTGKVTISASQSNGHIVVEVADDGRGLDADKLISRAVQRGILKSTDKITASEAYALVFVAGFSTKEQVTGVSGRGVGMDVVKTNIESLGGTVEIDSHLGHGTTFRLILPLTLAIIEGLVVRSGEQRYVLPLSSVQEMVQVAPENVSTVQGRYKMMSVRGEWTPLFLLDDLVNKRGQCERLLSPRIALLIRTGEDGLLAAAVDDVVERQQVVIKSVRGAISKMRGVSGAAILGDGKVALILDVLELAAAAGIIKTKMLGAA